MSYVIPRQQQKHFVYFKIKLSGVNNLLIYKRQMLICLHQTGDNLFLVYLLSNFKFKQNKKQQVYTSKR